MVIKNIGVGLLLVLTLVGVHGAGKQRKGNKVGRCPQLIDFLLGAKCQNPCNSDLECEGTKKCCLNDCGGNECLEPVEETRETMCEIACTRIYLPVCGNDGITYSNECTLNFTACTRNQLWIKMAYDGPCKEEAKEEKTYFCPKGDGPRPCKDEENLYNEQSPLIGRKKPQCDGDGYYLPVQCHPSTGMCWCASCSGTELTEPSRSLPPEETCLELRRQKGGKVKQQKNKL